MNWSIPLALALILALAGGALWHASRPSSSPPATIPQPQPAPECGTYPLCAGSCDGECRPDSLTAVCRCYNCSIKQPNRCAEGTCPPGTACGLNVTTCGCAPLGGILPPLPEPSSGWCTRDSKVMYAGLCNFHNATFTPQGVVEIGGVEYCNATTTGKAFYFTRDFSRCFVETTLGKVTLGKSQLYSYTRLDPAYCAEPEAMPYGPYQTVRYIAHTPFDYCIPGSTLAQTDTYLGKEHTATGTIQGMSEGHCSVKVDDLNNPAQPYTAEYLLDADGVAVYKSWTSGSVTETRDYRTRKFTLKAPRGTTTYDMTDSDQPDCVWDFLNFP